MRNYTDRLSVILMYLSICFLLFETFQSIFFGSAFRSNMDVSSVFGGVFHHQKGSAKDDGEVVPVQVQLLEIQRCFHSKCEPNWSKGGGNSNGCF